MYRETRTFWLYDITALQRATDMNRETRATTHGMYQKIQRKILNKLHLRQSFLLNFKSIIKMNEEIVDLLRLHMNTNIILPQNTIQFI